MGVPTLDPNFIKEQQQVMRMLGLKRAKKAKPISPKKALLIILPVFVLAFPEKVLINVDFPTFGIPATIARTGLFLMPRFRSLSFFAAQAERITLCTSFISPERLESRTTA